MSSTSTVSEVKKRDCEEIKKEIESNPIQFIGNDGKPMQLYQYKGHNFLPLEIGSSALSKLHTVKIRPDDILLYTHPGAVPYDGYFKHVQEFYALIKDNPNALIITYEEMKKELYKVVLHIAKFLDKTISDQLAKSIVDMCSFDKMKSEKTLVSASCVPENLFKEGGTFYHSGKVDTWKKWLTVEQSERIDAKIQSEFIDKGIIFNF
ncbi:estrogen sulfotransferase-like [Octopus vulgaris]|uniref:Estrogen sulfotransferase-like n=1 Tax=Octopus vulgaris TaxID=6645 RepID=A0AA36EZ12_OCTVU|nr:estrogen sulfotransferase-like [Octopus vulgaris]